MESFLEVKGKWEKGKLLLLCLAFLVCFAGNIFGQDLEILVNKIKHGTSEEKREALYQIRLIQTPEASRIAVLALQDSDEIVRVTATYSVIYLPSYEVFQLLEPFLNDKSPFVRKETAYAIGKAANPHPIPVLLSLLRKEKDIEIKSAIAVALGEIGEPLAIEELLKILQRKPKEEEDFLRRSAARSIGQIAQIQQVKTNYVVTPESLLEEKYDVLVNLKYPNLAEKLPIFKQANKVLLSVLQNQKESDDVRREAAFALGTIGDESAIQTLQNNLNAKDYYLAEICKESLAKLIKSSIN